MTLLLWLTLAIAVYAGFAALCLRGLGVARCAEWTGPDTLGDESP